MSWLDHSGCDAEVGVERSKTGGGTCGKNQMREDGILDWDLGSGDRAKWMESRSILRVERIELGEWLEVEGEGCES